MAATIAGKAHKSISNATLVAIGDSFFRFKKKEKKMKRECRKKMRRIGICGIQLKGGVTSVIAW